MGCSFKRIKQTLISRKGDSYIYLCVLVLFISMLLSVLILYMGLCAQVQTQKRDVKAKLDSYVSAYAVEAYDAIKQGSQYAELMDWTDFEDRTVVALGFTDPDMTVYEYPNANASMSRPTTTVLRGNGFGITVQYTAVFPIRWGGRTFADLEIPVTVTAYYKFK